MPLTRGGRQTYLTCTTLLYEVWYDSKLVYIPQAIILYSRIGKNWPKKNKHSMRDNRDALTKSAGKQMGKPLVKVLQAQNVACTSTRATTNYHNISLVSSSPQFLDITPTSSCIQQFGESEGRAFCPGSNALSVASHLISLLLSEC